MPNLATGLARVMELLEKADQGEWHRATECDGACCWHVFNSPIYSGQECIGISAPEMSQENAAAIVAAVNFLRKYGPEIAEAFKETPNG